YRRDLLTEAAAQAVTDRLHTALEALVTGPDRPASAITDHLASNPADPLTRARFWRQTLADPPARLTLPAAPGGTARGRTRVTLPPAVRRDLRQLTESTDTTWSALIRSALAVVLARLS